jgi:predicted ester cyclase
MATGAERAEQLKAWHRRVVEELWNNGNLDLIDEYLHPELHGTGQAAGVTRDDARQIVQEFRAAFPDLHVTIDNQIAEGDELATFSTIRGTHRAEFQGIQASGNSVELSTACHLKFADDKVIEETVEFDQEAFLSQLR